MMKKILIIIFAFVGVVVNAQFNYISKYTTIDSVYWYDSQNNYDARIVNSFSVHVNDSITNDIFITNSNFIYNENSEIEIYGKFRPSTTAQYFGNWTAGTANRVGFGVVGGNWRAFWGDVLLNGGAYDTNYHKFTLNKNGFYIDDVLEINLSAHTALTNTTNFWYYFGILGIPNIRINFEMVYSRLTNGNSDRYYIASMGNNDTIYDNLGNKDIIIANSINYEWTRQDSLSFNNYYGFDLWQKDVDSTWLYVPLNSGTSVRGSADEITGYTHKAKYTQNGTTFLPSESSLQLPLQSALYNTDSSNFWFSATKDTAYKKNYNEVATQFDNVYSKTDGYSTYNLSFLSDSVSSGWFSRKDFSMYCLGNSITNGIGTTPTNGYPNSYVYQLDSLLELDGHLVSTTKDGRNGYTSESMRLYLESNSFSHQDVVIIMLGINDSWVYRELPLSVYEAGEKYYFEMDSVIKLIKSKFTPYDIIFITPTPGNWGNISGSLSPFDDTSEPYYDTILVRAYDIYEKYKYDSVYLVPGENAIFVGDFLSFNDGLHLTNSGSLKLAKYIRDYTTLFIGKENVAYESDTIIKGTDIKLSQWAYKFNYAVKFTPEPQRPDTITLGQDSFQTWYDKANDFIQVFDPIVNDTLEYSVDSLGSWADKVNAGIKLLEP